MAWIDLIVSHTTALLKTRRGHPKKEGLQMEACKGHLTTGPSSIGNIVMIDMAMIAIMSKVY